MMLPRLKLAGLATLAVLGAGVVYYRAGPKAPSRVLPKPRGATEVYIQERIEMRPPRSSLLLPAPRVRVGTRLNANALNRFCPKGRRFPADA